MVKEKYCKKCDSKFHLFRWRHHCQFCDDTFCSSCYSKVPKERLLLVDPIEFHFGRGGIEHGACNSCYKSEGLQAVEDRINDALMNHHSVKTYSSNYKGNTGVNPVHFELIESSWYRDKDDCLKQLTVNARFMGRNTIDSIQYHKRTRQQDSDSGRGVYRYSEWTAAGRITDSEFEDEMSNSELPGINFDPKVIDAAVKSSKKKK